jgi:hypothetical protein
MHTPGGLSRVAQHLAEFSALGFFHLLCFFGLALGLKVLQELDVLVDVAVGALFVEGQELESLCFFLVGAGLRERVFDFGVVVGIACIGDVAGPDGEEVVFDGSGAIESPVIMRDSGDELDFGGALGFPFRHVAFEEDVVHDAIGLGSIVVTWPVLVLVNVVRQVVFMPYVVPGKPLTVVNERELT